MNAYNGMVSILQNKYNTMYICICRIYSSHAYNSDSEQQREIHLGLLGRVGNDILGLLFLQQSEPLWAPGPSQASSVVESLSIDDGEARKGPQRVYVKETLIIPSGHVQLSQFALELKQARCMLTCMHVCD